MHIMFERDDINTNETILIPDKVSFAQGVWCSKAWVRSPFVEANIPAGNRIICCSAGSYLRCSCPDKSEQEQRIKQCCPTTNYSVVRKAEVKIDKDTTVRNIRVSSDFLAKNSDCTDCLPGQFMNDMNLQRTKCYDCPTGWYQSEYGQPFCLPCEPGTTNPQSGQHICDICVSGRYLTAIKSNKTKCDECPKGQYQDEATKANCKGCEAGRWSSTLGLTSNQCTKCISGTYSKATGADTIESCIACEPG